MTQGQRKQNMLDIPCLRSVDGCLCGRQDPAHRDTSTHSEVRAQRQTKRSARAAGRGSAGWRAAPTPPRPPAGCAPPGAQQTEIVGSKDERPELNRTEATRKDKGNEKNTKDPSSASCWLRSSWGTTAGIVDLAKKEKKRKEEKNRTLRKQERKRRKERNNKQHFHRFQESAGSRKASTLQQ